MGKVLIMEYEQGVIDCKNLYTSRAWDQRNTGAKKVLMVYSFADLCLFSLRISNYWIGNIFLSVISSISLHNVGFIAVQGNKVFGSLVLCSLAKYLYILNFSVTKATC